MTQSSTPWPPPEAALIRRAREAMGLSHTEAARRLAIKIGARRWRQIEDGYESKGGRIAKGGDMQYAHMAHVVGVAPDDLRSVGRDEAAEVLQKLIDTTSRPAGTLPALTGSMQGEVSPDRLTVVQGGGEPPTPDQFEGRALARLEEISQAVGLNDQPPFPNPTSKTQQAANQMWQAFRLLVEDDPSDATVRGVIRRGAVDLEELQEREKLRG